MMVKVNNTECVSHLFAGWHETLIWSCLQQVMGNLYASANTGMQVSAIAVLGDFCFCAGRPDEKFFIFQEEWKKDGTMIIVPQNTAWSAVIENHYGSAAKKVIRYAVKKEEDIFDRQKLQKAVMSLPDGFELKMIDKELYNQCKNISWCSDWVANYQSYELYHNYGLGAVILKDGEPVSGASSYAGYLKGIEVEVDTKEEYRRRGLAYICGAKLILECLDRKLYPSWDAQNPWSAALAEKLGYNFDYEYTAYEV